MTEPTIVLVHGAFADTSIWAPVRSLLADRGLGVVVPAISARSLSADAAAVRAIVESLPGAVLLVGHAYGGAVITVAGVADHVVGLVYVAGYALEDGESLGDLQCGFPEVIGPAEQFSAPYPAFGEPASVAAWRSRPAWGVIAAADDVVNPDVTRFGYRRAAIATIVELDAPHAVPITHPAHVVKVITDGIAELGFTDPL